MTMETIALVLAIAAGAYMAWNIGANDVANAMGTSVGSRALTLLGAVVVAGVFEFGGAFFVGGRVTQTISKSIVDLTIVADQPWALVAGMIAALLAAAIWLNIASWLGWPVSTTHSIVGGVIGFGILLGGLTAIEWATAGRIILSWIISPVSGALLAILVYQVLVLPIYRSKRPSRQLRRVVPPATGMVFFLLSLSMLYKGLKNLHLDLPLGEAILIAAVVGLTATAVAHVIVGRQRWQDSSNFLGRFRLTEPVFAVLQVITACYMAFAHGANDVANAVGPLAAVAEVVRTGTVAASVPIPTWVLAMGGAGIVVGLATYGYRVIATVGRKITSITPSRGFSAEFGCATTVLVCSKLGLPVSTTHTLVGAVVGVGLVRGLRGLDLRVVRDIAVSWVVTIPFTAVLTVAFFALLRTWIP